MKIEQIVVQPDTRTVVTMTRSELGVPGTVSLQIGELSSAAQVAVETLVAAGTPHLPDDLSPAVLAEIRQLEARLRELRPQSA